MTRQRWLRGLVVALLLSVPLVVRAQSGPFSAQIQRLFYRANTWFASQTLDTGVIGVTSTDGWTLQNLTAAAAGAQQISPRLHFTGQGWKTNAVAASQATDLIEELLPVQGAAAPTFTFRWRASINGGAYSDILTLTDAGVMALPGAPLGVASGGTGIASYAIGDLIYASAATTLSPLADVAAGSYLRSGGVVTAPVWSTLTIPNTSTAGGLFVSTATSVMGEVVDAAVGQVLTSGGVGVVPAYRAAPVLGVAISQAGTLGLAKGVAGGAVWTLASAATTAWTMTGAAVVPAQGDLLVFSTATGQMASVVDVAVGQVLISGGVGLVPTYSASPTVTILGVLNGTAGAPSLHFATTTNGIFYDPSADRITFASAGVNLGGMDDYGGGTLVTNKILLDQANLDVWMERGGVGQVSLNTAGTFGGAGVSLNYATDALLKVFTRASGSTTPANFLAATAQLTTPRPTAGAGVGITVNDAGSVRQLTYQVTVAYTAFTCNATTCARTLVTMPAKSRVVNVVADVTIPFVCAPMTCTTATLSDEVGETGVAVAGYLKSFDVDAAVDTFGTQSADIGVFLDTTGGLRNGTYIPDVTGVWGSTNTIDVLMTSGAGNLATGGVTNLTAGSVTYYIDTIVYP